MSSNKCKRVNDEWLITTPEGNITCEYVVNAAGYKAAEVGKMFGRNVPCVSLAHQYLITEPIPELEANKYKVPLLRDPDSSYYLRQEKDGLLLGPYEKIAGRIGLHLTILCLRIFHFNYIMMI